MSRETALARVEPTPEMGPAMRALSPRWRACVMYLFITNGDQTKALELAGYKADNRESLNVTASKMFSDDRMRAAIREEATKHIDICEPEMLGLTLGIARDAEEKAADRLRAMAMIWDRANPVINKLKLDVEHHINDAERDLRHWHALKKLGAPPEAFLARFGPNGLPRVEAMVLAEEARHREIEGGSTIEAEYQEIDATDVVEPAEPIAPATAASPDFDEDMVG